MSICRAAVLCASVAIIAATAEGRDYWVSNEGRNAGPGSLAAPFRTLSRAAEAARPGDAIYVRAGTYYANETISCRGTASARITIQPYRGEKVAIDGAGTPHDTNVITLRDAAWVDFSGFEIRNASRIGICLWDVRDVRIVRNHVHDTWRNGIYVGGEAAGSNRDVVIEGNDVHDAVEENSRRTLQQGGWSSAVSFTYGVRARVAGNRVHHNGGEGISVGLARNVLVEGNEVFDNYSSNIYIDSSGSIRVNRNLVYSTGEPSFFRFDMPAIGIATAHEDWAKHSPLGDLTITNNIVINTRWGFYYGAYEAGGGLKNTTVANNTFYKAAAALLAIDRDRHADSVVENNVFDQPEGGRLAAVGGSGITYRNNNWHGGSPGAAAGAGDINADPRLTNPGGLKASDYRLTASSPVVARGAPVRIVTSDYFGTPRAGAWDIGAHQLSGTSARTAARLGKAYERSAAFELAGCHRCLARPLDISRP